MLSFPPVKRALGRRGAPPFVGFLAVCGRSCRGHVVGSVLFVLSLSCDVLIRGNVDLSPH